MNTRANASSLEHEPEMATARRRERVRESMAQADAGELIAWESVEKWIESWGTEGELTRPEVSKTR